MMAHDPSLFAGGAALNALDDDEVLSFQQHLADCATCQSELLGFQETAARLGSASAETAPSSMRDAVMARIAVTRQLPPQIAHDADNLPTSNVRVAEAADPVRVETLPEPRLAEVVDLSSRRRLRSRILLSAAIAVAVALAALSVTFFVNRNTSTEDALRSCVESASDQHQLSAVAGSEGQSSVTVSASCGAALVRMSQVAAPAAGKTYQLWVIAGNEVRSVGLLTPDAGGTMPDTVAPVRVGDTAIGLTVEPTGGSVKPTMPPVITVPLAA